MFWRTHFQGKVKMEAARLSKTLVSCHITMLHRNQKATA